MTRVNPNFLIYLSLERDAEAIKGSFHTPTVQTLAPIMKKAEITIIQAYEMNEAKRAAIKEPSGIIPQVRVIIIPFISPRIVDGTFNCHTVVRLYSPHFVQIKKEIVPSPKETSKPSLKEELSIKHQFRPRGASKTSSCSNRQLE